MKTLADFQARLDELRGRGDCEEWIDAFNELADSLLFSGDAGTILPLAEDALEMARRLGYAAGEACTLFHLGTANWLVTRLETALSTLLEAEAVFRELGDESGLAKTRGIVAAVYRSLGDLDQAFLIGLPPVEYFQTVGDDVWEARARLSLGMTCHELGDYDGALRHRERALELREDSGEQWILGRAMSGIGAAHGARGDYREALRWHLRALKTGEAAGARMGEARALHEIAGCHEQMGDRKKAREFYERALRIREEIDQREAQCTTLIALGRLCAADNPEEALGFLDRAVSLAQEVGAKPRIYQAHLALSEVHEERGDHEAALEHHQAYHRVHAEVEDRAAKLRVKNLRTVFDAEKREREAEIARLKESLEEGGSLGSYRLTRKLGSGAMGDVWEGQHRLLARPAAIKVIRTKTLEGPAYERLVQRFRREAEATASLRSPHTVQLYDFGESDGGTFHYVMELLEGMDVRQMVERFGPLPPARVVYLLRQACRSLAEAHDAGLVHRDIKPANLFVCRLGGEHDFLKVVDFGIVKTDGGEDEMHLTEAGTLPGTPAFVAPEMVTAEAVDGRSDLYSLGCTAFWMLAGMPVFSAKTPTAMLMEHVRTEPPPVSQLAEQRVPKELEALVAGCLAKDPRKRPESAGALEERLRELECCADWDEVRAKEWWERNAAPGTEVN
ncbi:MAG TPA: tetratricopeptide repeat protein [bacterium]|nr:tetratricopeptide repeat protein [bacterium]